MVMHVTILMEHLAPFKVHLAAHVSKETNVQYWPK